MKIAYVLVISVFILALIGYGERSEANDINAFVKACDSSTNLGEPICKCLAKKADKRLTPNGFAFLVAGMNKDDEKTAKLRSQLEMSEAAQAGMFMVKTPEECAGELEGN
jgi:hypothetical protein